MLTALKKTTSDKHSSERDVREKSTQGRLLRGYLHKTSNSLCGIKGYASLIVDEKIQTRSASQWAQKIITEVERMEEIFRSVGDLTGSRQIPDLEVNLPSVVSEVVRQCGRTFGNLDIFTGTIPCGDLLLPAVDLALILQEIIKNSSESAANAEDTVRVEVSGEALVTGRLALTIRDDGPGIPEELIGQITDPFLTTKPGHMGIGLARVETLVEMYGLAWVLRSTPGLGTTITLETAVLTEPNRAIV